MELESKPFSLASRKGFIQTHSINLSTPIAPNPLLTKDSLYFTYSSALVCNNFSKRLCLRLGLSISHTEIKMQPHGLAKCLYPTLLQFCTFQTARLAKQASPCCAPGNSWEHLVPDCNPKGGRGRYLGDNR